MEDQDISDSVSGVVVTPVHHRVRGVEETCLKEALTFDIPPLGFHLSVAVKEKILKNEYVDFLSLLPSAKTKSFNNRHFVLTAVS